MPKSWQSFHKWVNSVKADASCRHCLIIIFQVMDTHLQRLQGHRWQLQGSKSAFNHSSTTSCHILFCLMSKGVRTTILDRQPYMKKGSWGCPCRTVSHIQSWFILFTHPSGTSPAEQFCYFSLCVPVLKTGCKYCFCNSPVTQSTRIDLCSLKLAGFTQSSLHVRLFPPPSPPFFSFFFRWRGKKRDGRMVKRKSSKGQTHKQWTALEKDYVGSLKWLGLFQPVSSTGTDMKSLAN